MRGPPVVLTNTLGRPVTNVISERGAVPMTVVNTLGEPVTLVNSGGEPVTLFNANGTLWDYPFSLFSNNEQGAWYDPSDYSTLFQNSTGTTPVTAVEQPVRLMLDRSRGLVLGGELVSNPGGPYTATTGWVAGFNVTTSTLTAGSGLLTLTANGTDAAPRFVIPITGLTSGRSYDVQFTGCAATGTGDRYGVWTSGSNGTGGTVFDQTIVASWTGTKRLLITATAATMYLCIGMAGTPTAGSTLSIASASVRELPGNHALAPNDASRPVLRSRYNLLTYSEQFDNAAWTKTNATVTANAAVAPDGTTTADKFATSGGGTGSSLVRLTTNLTVTPGAGYIFSCYAKKDAGSDRIILRYEGDFVSAATEIQFDLNAGSVITTPPAGITASIQLAGNGFYRCVVTLASAFTTSGTGGGLWLRACTSAGGLTVPLDGTVSYTVWGAQLLTAADQTSTGGAYQRIAAATDYDTSNPVWRPYLAFDGSDDSFSTSSIDFSATDEMTVFAGVHKASDAARGMLVELSATAATNVGSFFVDAPSNTTDYGAALFEGTPLRRASTYAAPITNALTVLLDIAGATEADEIQIRANGAAASMTTVNSGTETGNFGNYPLFIGRRNNASLPLNGRLTSLIVLGRTATAAEIGAMEAWVAGKTGVTI